jgi:hypothetical protein
MIELYRPDDCLTCADIELALKEMVIAHKVITVAANQQPEGLPPKTPLPALKDNGQIIAGQAAISARLRELEEFVTAWQRFQSDACYIDDQGKAC